LLNSGAVIKGSFVKLSTTPFLDESITELAPTMLNPKDLACLMKRLDESISIGNTSTVLVNNFIFL